MQVGLGIHNTAITRNMYIGNSAKEMSCLSYFINNVNIVNEAFDCKSLAKGKIQ